MHAIRRVVHAEHQHRVPSESRPERRFSYGTKRGSRWKSPRRAWRGNRHRSADLARRRSVLTIGCGQRRCVAVICVDRRSADRISSVWGLFAEGVATVVMPSGADGRGPGEHWRQRCFLTNSFGQHRADPEGETAQRTPITMWSADTDHGEGTWPTILGPLHKLVDGLYEASIRSLQSDTFIHSHASGRRALIGVAESSGSRVAAFGPCS